MRFVSCECDGERFAGLVDGDHVVPLAGVTELGLETPIEVLRDPPLRDRDRVARADVRLRAVVPAPQRIICVGLNYRSHIEETGRGDSDYPVLFTKFASSLIGADDPIAVPPESEQVDYEAELAIIIGRPARRVAERDALDHVAGYAVANDVTVRDYQYKTHQWLQGKSWDATTPVGPELVTADEVDPSRLAIRLEIDGRELQSSNTDLMISSPARLISVCSQFTTLMPGDIILSGTPGGVGFRRDPQVFMTPGQRVIVDIDGVGRLSNDVVAEAVASDSSA